jgi:hypothetical protein
LKRNHIFALAASVAGLLCGVATAQAQELKFTYVEPDGVDISFEQLANPTPTFYALGQGTIVDVADWTGTPGPYTNLTWYASGAGGGFSTPDFVINLFGGQVYTGTEAAPVFAPGVYTGTEYSNGEKGTLTVTLVSVPEPATWAMLLIGLAATGAALRTARRREGAALAAA